MDIKAMSCMPDTTLREVLEIIDKNAKGIAFVTDSAEKLEGVVTDGDIRRGFIHKNISLDSPISLCMNTEYIYAYTTDNLDEIARRFDRKIAYIPILDDAARLIDCYECKMSINIPIARPELGGNELKYLTEAFVSTWISSTGKYIDQFEERFSSYCGTIYGVAVSNGTTALHLALAALGIKEGDEVIVPDLTFAATINAVLYTGATPVIVDIEEDSWCIDPSEIEKAINSRTKAIIPVHIYGQPCEMDRIMEIAERNNLYVIEDCAEAHGAEYKGKKVGSFGTIGCFSFYANKVITTGEGGMCLTNDEMLNEKMRLLRDHGMSKQRKYYHAMVGYNYRMTNMQAAIGVAQLERIGEMHRWRCDLEQNYRVAVENIKGLEMQRNDLPNRKKTTWLISAIMPEEKRGRFIDRMKEEGIDIRPFFIPLSHMEIYEKYTFSNAVSTKISCRGINFPTISTVSESTIHLIAQMLEEICN